MNRKKEIYRLWYEYLKKSDEYKEYCKYLKDRIRDPNTPPHPKFQKDRHGRPSAASWNYIKFCDIHSYSFEEWWDKLGHRSRKRVGRPNFPEIVDNYLDWIDRDLQSCIEITRSQVGDVTLEEFKNHFIKKLSRDPWSIFLTVDLSANNTELIKEFKKILMTKKNNSTYKAYEKQFDIRFNKPTSPVYLGELKKYLKAYDLKSKGMTIRQIIGEMGTTAQRLNAGDADTQRTFRSYISKARKIIKNVEQGYFPGKYQ